jgi:hypothetical protein
MATVHNIWLLLAYIVNIKNRVFWAVTPCGSSKNDVSRECIASSIRVTRIGDLGRALIINSNGGTCEEISAGFGW